MTDTEERHEERCPTCGRFVGIDEGYGDVEPGGARGHDYLATYCNEGCAERKWPPAEPELSSSACDHCGAVEGWGSTTCPDELCRSSTRDRRRWEVYSAGGSRCWNPVLVPTPAAWRSAPAVA